MRGSTPIDVEPRQGAWSDVERGAGPLALGAMHAALFALMRGDRSRSRTSVSELTRIVSEHDLPLFRAFGVFLEGWATAEAGAPFTSGRVRYRRSGAEDGSAALLVPGLSAHMHGFDHVADRLAATGRRIVAMDLRGRGRSEITPAGSYGLEAHCHDLLDIASLLGAERFDWVGWSMGAFAGVPAQRTRRKSRRRCTRRLRPCCRRSFRI